MAYDIVLLPGDGIGVEVASEAQKMLDLVQAELDLAFDVQVIPCGGRFFLEHGSRDWPEGSEERCSEADAVLLGAVGWPSPDGSGPVTMPDGNMAGWSPVIGNRARLDLYANVRKVKKLPGIKARIHGRHRVVWDDGSVDMVFIRENTEDLYAGIGGVLPKFGPGNVATDTRVITRFASERVIRMAFEVSRQRDQGAPLDGTKRVTSIAKDNVLYGCRLFQKVFAEIGAEYPDIEKDTAIVDAMTQWLIGQPEYYDVLVTTNMFGDILTDLASVLQGGMGMAVGCNVGDDHAMFEPIHGSAPKHAGHDRANPMAMILSTAEMCTWLGERKGDAQLSRAGALIEQAVAVVVESGETLTYDLVGRDNASPMSAVSGAVREAFVRLARQD